MAEGWIETYRGAVNPWECDVVAHFTIAFYFARFADATALFLRSLGVDSRALTPREIDVRFLRELRAGDCFHIESALAAGSQHDLRIVLRAIDSATGERVTQAEVVLWSSAPFSPHLLSNLERRTIDWEESLHEPRPQPATLEGFLDAARDWVAPHHVDERGTLTVEQFVHRYSTAALQLLARVGMTPEYSRERHVGFSTFELQLRFFGELRGGSFALVRNAPLHVGGSSLRMFHRMFDASSAREVAQMSQMGVQLDMEARRPTPFGDEIRARAEAQLVACQPL